MPIRVRARPDFARLFTHSASILYLRNNGLRLDEVGDLAASLKTVKDDNCRASCVDWYGESRPIFLGDRVFALLGYELVEGVITGARIKELKRLNYAPNLSETASN
jgi:hypothetical protein